MSLSGKTKPLYPFIQISLLQTRLAFSATNVALLTRHFTHNNRLESVEFHIRCEIEVLSRMLVNLRKAKWVCELLRVYRERERKKTRTRWRVKLSSMYSSVESALIKLALQSALNTSLLLLLSRCHSIIKGKKRAGDWTDFLLNHIFKLWLGPELKLIDVFFFFFSLPPSRLPLQFQQSPYCEAAVEMNVNPGHYLSRLTGGIWRGD